MYFCMKKSRRMKAWFESWFDTPYYHILYKNRDHSEAEVFIPNLFGKLALSKDKKVLDLACGKGRHAIFVNSLGYPTTGVDLSAQSIQKAKENENERLHFFQHDMRLPLKSSKFDLVLNLFTSFGYFDQTDDNETMLNSVHSYLEENGKLVIDFFNAEKVKSDLVEEEIKTIEGIDFKRNKTITEGCIVKDIRFSDNGETYHFQEKVQLLDENDFRGFLSRANFTIEKIYGNYQFSEFDKDSDRLIIIAKKNKE